jgi:DNA processing protein
MLAIAEGFGESPIPGLLLPDVDPEALLLRPPEPPVVPARVARRLRQHDLQAQAQAMRQEAAQLGMRLLTPSDDDWPERLSQQPLAPLALFVKGDAGVMQCEPACAAVGSRTPTPYGIDAAKSLCAAMARSGTILWSGLARGIDGIAHAACLAAETPTVAVLAGSIDCIYPPEHEDLANRIVAHGGCLVSELPPRRRARRGHFVRRNRLLAAGPPAVLVIEGSLTSGALHTARFATDCSTEVFAVPGPWQSERSQGCHRLIAEGAGIVESPESLLQSLGLVMHSAKTALHLETSAQQQTILAQLSSGPRPTDLLQRECALENVAFLRALFGLEQNGWIERLPGDLWRSMTG